MEVCIANKVKNPKTKPTYICWNTVLNVLIVLKESLLSNARISTCYLCLVKRNIVQECSWHSPQGTL